jgi:hypothetical protein
MTSMETIRRILEGHLEAFDARASTQVDASDALGRIARFDESPPTAATVEEFVTELLETGQVLKSLTLLKILSAIDPSGEAYLPALGRILEWSPGPGRGSQNPLAREFLGTTRLHTAWFVLSRDRLEVAVVPNENGDFGADGWTVCRDASPRPYSAPHGLALVWWSMTKVAGKVRPAGQRRVSRRKISLAVHISVLGGPPAGGQRKIEAEMDDLSITGAGLHVRDPYGRLRGQPPLGRRLRMEVNLPSSRDPLATLADVVWMKEDMADDEPVVRLGIHFVESPPEFTDAVRELLVNAEGDQQYLWNLWELQTSHR